MDSMREILPSEQRSVRSASLEDECTPGRVYDYLAGITGNNLKKAIKEFTEKLHQDDPELDLRLFWT